MIAPALECVDLAVGYADDPVLAGLDLSVRPGQVLALLGPSGSGKSTLLHAIAGFIAPLAGQIRLGGQVCAGRGHRVPPERRRVGMVFQDFALWPHMPVRDIVAYPLRRRGLGAGEARRRAEALLAGLDIAGLAGRRPAELSGGQAQRVGLARALAQDPQIYLFDEPTAHLDAHLRTLVLEEIAQRRAASGAAAVYATHDSAEALAVADRVAVVHGGRLVQIAAPTEVYERPADLTVARLTGWVSTLDIPARRTGTGLVSVDIGGVPATVACAGADPPGMVLVRPEWASLDGTLPGRVNAVRYRGPHTDHHVATPGGTVVIRAGGPPRRAVGDATTWSLHRIAIVPARALEADDPDRDRLNAVRGS